MQLVTNQHFLKIGGIHFCNWNLLFQFSN